MTGPKIDIIAVGKLKEKFWQDACKEYLKRLQAYTQIKVVEVIDIGAKSAADVSLALASEGASITDKLVKDSFCIVLDSHGAQLTSTDLAQKLQDIQLAGRSHISFVIGGSWGVLDEVKKSADLVLSLGSLTLPHNLARVVLLEQIYRSFRIALGQPYHK